MIINIRLIAPMFLEYFVSLNKIFLSYFWEMNQFSEYVKIKKR